MRIVQSYGKTKGNSTIEGGFRKIRLKSDSDTNMTIEISTPTLLFSAITLLMLAYTNRFLAIANLVRQFHALYKENPDKNVLKQIRNFRVRLKVMRNMQFFGILSFLTCVICMFFIYADFMVLANALFVSSLVLLMISLVFSLWEVYISVDALNVQLSDIENEICE